MRNFLIRSITGILFVVVITASIIIGQEAFTLLFATIMVFALREFWSMPDIKANMSIQVLGIIIYVFIFIALFFILRAYISPVVILFLFPIYLLMLASSLFIKSFDLKSIAYVFLGGIWIALPLMLMQFLFIQNDYAFFPGELLLVFFIIIWLYDSGAYIIGSLIGKHKMCPRISPLKSWEGMAGGLIIGLLAAYFVSGYLKILTLQQWMLFAFVIIAAANFGDFFESWVKRGQNLKDSGNWLPGHGGLLDRFDSIFFAAPAAATFLFFIFQYNAL